MDGAWSFWAIERSMNLPGRRCGQEYISQHYYKQKKIVIKCEDTMQTKRERRNCLEVRHHSQTVIGTFLGESFGLNHGCDLRTHIFPCYDILWGAILTRSADLWDRRSATHRDWPKNDVFRRLVMKRSESGVTAFQYCSTQWDGRDGESCAHRLRARSVQAPWARDMAARLYHCTYVFRQIASSANKTVYFHIEGLDTSSSCLDMAPFSCHHLHIPYDPQYTRARPLHFFIFW